MNTRQSCVISVSAGTGCYRHIQIAADATLFILHRAILDAFHFEDDHQHAFFMDNRLWSNVDCYRSTGKNSTRKCKLSSLALGPGTSFQYLFDFGDEWVFRCKFLRALDEPCDLPRVIRSKGDAPQQYGQESEFDADEDGEEMVLPELYSKAELKKNYDALNLPEETVTMLHQYFAAMANLYGIISLRKALDIINAQNSPISEQTFLAFAEIARHEEHYYAILGEDELYADGKKSAPMEREIVHESLYAVDLAEYDEMQDRQRGKPYYIPPKELLLKYADEDYFETTSQSNAVERYLRQEKKLSAEQAKDFVLEIQLHAASGETNMQLVMDDLNRMGMQFEDIDEVRRFLTLFTDLSNHSRMQSNRGYTPEEIRAMHSPQGQIPKSITFGPNMMKAFRDGTMDVAEYRRAIAQMKLPNEAIRASMLSQLNEMTTGAQPKIKVGRNALCPCGSGKKYKKCCGKNE